jgi:hypothetical protein
MGFGITIKNESDIPILVQVMWGYSPITAKEIAINSTETLQDNMGWVWYDLNFRNSQTTGMFLRKNAVYASSSWKFTGQVGQYHLTEV